ncbi:MAG TPA: M90 family metallopeptidase [Flavisolibacter sp.]|jgi:Mlc titration factor MtfA (ptsG expression regulator)|nr:M90 family metallopeptidase [Flavisolibacter sp.]
MATVLQILFVLVLIIIIILLVFQPKRTERFLLPENFRDLLADYVSFYADLDEDGRKRFEDRLQKFLGAVKITGANAQVEDLDLVLIGAAAIIPVFAIPDWEYVNLREVLVYPGNFNHDYDQQGSDRMVSGMVGTGGMENVMILSKWELRQGFINGNSNRNTAIHEFVHLVDKMDGTLDGVPELLLERKYVDRWKHLLQEEMAKIRLGQSDIDAYGATSPVECFAVIAEYFFTRREAFQLRHPQLNELMERAFVRK